MSSVPSGHPLRFFFRSASFFMWEVINLADSPGWGKKVTACSRWLFFGSGELGDKLRFEIQIDQILILSIYIDFFRVWKSFIACQPILVIFFRLMVLVPARLGLKVMGRKVTFSL